MDFFYFTHPTEPGIRLELTPFLPVEAFPVFATTGTESRFERQARWERERMTLHSRQSHFILNHVALSLLSSTDKAAEGKQINYEVETAIQRMSDYLVGKRLLYECGGRHTYDDSIGQHRIDLQWKPLLLASNPTKCWLSNHSSL